MNCIQGFSSAERWVHSWVLKLAGTDLLRASPLDPFNQLRMFVLFQNPQEHSDWTILLSADVACGSWIQTQTEITPSGYSRYISWIQTLTGWHERLFDPCISAATKWFIDVTYTHAREEIKKVHIGGNNGLGDGNGGNEANLVTQVLT